MYEKLIERQIELYKQIMEEIHKPMTPEEPVNMEVVLVVYREVSEDKRMRDIKSQRHGLKR